MLKQQRRCEEHIDSDVYAQGKTNINHPTLRNSATSATGIGGHDVNCQEQSDAPSIHAGIAPVELDIVEDGRVQSSATFPLASSSQSFGQSLIEESMAMWDLVAGQQEHVHQGINLSPNDPEVSGTCIIPAGCNHSSFMLWVMQPYLMVGGRTSPCLHFLNSALVQ